MRVMARHGGLWRRRMLAPRPGRRIIAVAGGAARQGAAKLIEHFHRAVLIQRQMFPGRLRAIHPRCRDGEIKRQLHPDFSLGDINVTVPFRGMGGVEHMTRLVVPADMRQRQRIIGAARAQ